jgi:hypothetical protein
VARALLGQDGMVTAPLSTPDRATVLRFAASFLWADLAVVPAERRFLHALARELDPDGATSEIEELLARPPAADDVDPGAVRAAVADVVRHAVLRAIAADGRVDPDEMQLFELLDELLPGGPLGGCVE